MSLDKAKQGNHATGGRPDQIQAGKDVDDGKDGSRCSTVAQAFEAWLRW